jgi:cytochrome c biogenesis protein CcmG/thiol:disulfide interchange protein DsbE
MIIHDYDGRTSIDFGVYAAPETFLVDANGVIVFKQLGALTPEVINQEILPRIGYEGSFANR